jgi:hypothetical protein
MNLQEITNNDFVWVEQAALMYLLRYQTKEDFAFILKNMPKLIYSSNLGQTDQMDIFDWQQISDRWFTEFNINLSRREEICLKNPLKLVQM